MRRNNSGSFPNDQHLVRSFLCTSVAPTFLQIKCLTSTLSEKLLSPYLEEEHMVQRSILATLLFNNPRSSDASLWAYKGVLSYAWRGGRVTITSIATV